MLIQIIYSEAIQLCVCDWENSNIDWFCVHVCVLGLSLGSLSRGPGEQMAERAKDEARQFRNGNRGMREG